MGSKRRRSFVGRVARSNWPAGLAIGVIVVVLIFVGFAALIHSSGDGYVSATQPSDAKISAFIGDSDTVGNRAEPTSARWTTQLSTRMHWTEKNFGRAGTGYWAHASGQLCGQATCPDYRGILAEVAASRPSIAVVSGGLNDLAEFTADRPEVTSAIDDTFQQLRRLLPTARIVAVGPSTLGAATADSLAFDAAVHSAGSAVGAQYVSLLAPKPVIQMRLLSPDGQINDDGQVAIANRIASALS